MKRLFSLTRALVARKRKIFALFFALAASIGMMNAKVTWNRCNISDLDVHGTNASYSKEGVTLSANADHIFAMWQGYGDESHDGISFMTTDETGGFTFSNTLGKNFTKIEMFPNGPGIWDMANLGSGWSFSWDPSENKPVTVTWTGNASTVDLVKDVSDFHGENVKKIVFYFEGDSEEPDPTYTVALKDGTANADKVTLSATSVEECTTVTVTPNEECDITAFKATYNTTEELSTSFNTETGAYSFTMPAANVTIEATIALKPVPEGDVFAGFTATAGSGGFDNEGHANLVDNKFTSADWTKWCADNSYKSVPTGETGDACWWIDFEASAALNPTGYILTTGNDTGNEHGRNPKNWLLKAKLNADDAWTTIATVTNDVTMKDKSFKDYKFFVDQSGSYKYFRFEVFANQGANVMQLCQLRLIGTDAPANACGDGLTWELNNGELVISYDGKGTGVMNDYSWDPNAAPWYAYKDAITSVSFPEGITTIGAYAFVSCDNAAFTKVTIPEGVTALGVNAFYNCDGIQEITIPSTVTTIQTGAIYDCKAVNSITSYIASPTNLHGFAIYGYKSTCTLYVPYNSIAAYQAAECWKSIPNIAAIPGTLTPESVAALIDAIGEVAYTAECKAKIDAARAAYDDLSTEDKALVDAAKLTALTTAEANFTTAKTEAVNAVKNAIDALPALPLTDATKKLSEYNKVKAARAAYDALLNADDKALVTNLTKLEAAEEAFAGISGGTPAGALSGKFSIDESSVVYFSKGNLQATTTDNGTNWTWSFAANQWNTIGNAAANTAISGNGTVSENGTVDLFGWSTTATYYGIHNSTSEYDYEGDFVDWGATMGAGWRTLTCDEWNHLLFNRTMQSSQSSPIRYARSTVNGIQGMIIVPDDWDEAYYTLADSYDFDNIISAADWTDKLEAHGAVFLPVTGFRSGTSWQPDDGGHYSTPTPYTKYSGFIENMNFNGSGVASSGVMGVSDGLSVRLVTAGAASPLADALAAKDLIDAIGEVSYPDSKEAIKAAREALDALSDEAKAFFAKADTAALPAAEATYAELLAAAQEKADAVVAKIDAIPATIEFTEACGNAIEAAREAYDALTDAEKALVPAEKLTVLTDAEVAYERAAPTTDLSTLTADYEVRDGKTLIGTLANNVMITIAPGATVTLSNVNINGDNTWTGGDYAGITCPGDATIILADGTVNKIRGFLNGNAALHIKPGYTLTIEGNGTLYASTNGGASAIGCGYSAQGGSRDGGNIVINGGTIYATGGNLGSGIGGGGRAKIGDITINGGIIFATGGGTGAGIGGGQSKNSGWKSECGNITISSSVKYLNATKGSGAEHSVGKGSSSYSVCGTLSVGGNTTGLISTSPYIYCPPADAVEVLIDAIGTLAYTPECKARIDAARAAYDALEIQEMKDAVENYATLTAAEEAYASATDEIALINAIPNPVEFTDACKEAIDAARAAYDAMTEAGKALVTNYATLTAAESKYAVDKTKALINALPDTPLADEDKKLSEYNKVTDAREAYDELSAEDKAAVPAEMLTKLEAVEAAFAAIGGGDSGALKGKFSVADGKVVYFSKGNLQATTTDLGANWTWSFAANQWNTIGNAVANTKISGNGEVSENGTVDLFGWSTSTTFYGIHNSTDNGTYYASFVDWSSNTDLIASLGEDWRTLTSGEWTYLLNTRTTTSGVRYAKATVNTVAGLIILPDNWNEAYHALASTNNSDVDFNDNKINSAEWTSDFQAHGAVFLPAAGLRSGTNVSEAGSAGYYWSATSVDAQTADYMYFNDVELSANSFNRLLYGRSVRLVTENAPVSPLADAQAVKDLIDAIGEVSYPDSKEAIKAAREALDALSDEAKALFATADTAALPAAEATYAGLLAEKVAPVIAAIDAIPSPIEDNLKLSVYDKVTDARALYDALTDEEKAAVTNYGKLTAAEAAFAAISGGDAVVVWSTETLGMTFEIGQKSTSEPKFGITLTTGEWRYFTTYEGNVLRFGFNTASNNNGFTFTNTSGSNLTKIVVSLNGTQDKELTYFETPGWTLNTTNRTLTWEGDASNVSIWDNLTEMVGDVNVDFVQFTIPGASSPLNDAQAALDKINAIPQPVVYTPECSAAIKAAREAVDALGENASLLDDADLQKLKDAEAAYADLLAEKVAPVIAAINALPATPLTPENTKLSEYNKVTDARALYDALTDEEKAAVTNYDKLTAAEEAFAAINNGGGTIYDSGSVALTDLKVGDILKGGVSLTGEATDKVGLQSLAQNGEKKDGEFILSFEYMTPLLGENAAVTSGSMVFTPIAEDGNAGDAWIVFDGSALTEATVWLKGINSAALPSVLADAQAAVDLINAIPQPVVYTPECSAAIKAAREAVDALGENASLLDDADLQKLTDAEAAYAALLAEKVAPVIAAIDAIPSPIEDNLKLSVYDKVTDARALYDALSDEEKAAVSNYEKLTAAEAAFAAIDKGAGTVYDSGSVALTDLKVGDILKGGVTLIAEASDKIGTLRVAMNGEKKEGVFYILPFEHMNPLLGENAAISHGPNVFSPIAEDGNAGDAWIVTDGSNQATVWLRGISTAALPSIFADAQAAVDLINAIPDPVVLSDECKAKIDAAREAVTALGENASLIDDADIDKLAKAEADFALLIKDATAVVAKIDAIGDVTFSAECKEKIVDARNAYEALSDELKPYVTNLGTLTDAEAAYEAARPFAPVTTVPAAVEALQYTGAAQTLITAGAVEHGTILYSLDGVDYSAELPTALLSGAYTVYYKVQATDDYKDVAPATFIATIAYNYPATYGLFGIPEGWSVKVNDEEVAVVNGAVKNIAANDRFDIMPVKPEDVKLVEIVPYLLDLATATDSVIYLMNGDSITGTAKGNISIVIVPDAKVYFKNVNLTNTGSHPAVLCGGNAEMVVVGENSITCTTEGESGIRAAGAGTTLTISGDKAHLSATIDPNGGTVNQ